MNDKFIYGLSRTSKMTVCDPANALGAG